MLAATDEPTLCRSNTGWTFLVDPARLAYDTGDLARALDVNALERGLARRTVWLGGRLTAIVGAAGCSTDDGYSLMHGLILVPIEEYGGPVHTHHRPLSPGNTLAGTLIQCRYGTCVVAGDARIERR